VDVGRVLGSTQADLVGPVTITDPGHTHTDAGHTHSYTNNMGGGNGGSSGSASPTAATTGSGVADIQSNTTGILIASGAETRPKNVAMMYIIKS
jgi:hypothetical protein